MFREMRCLRAFVRQVGLHCQALVYMSSSSLINDYEVVLQEQLRSRIALLPLDVRQAHSSLALDVVRESSVVTWIWTG